MENESLVTALGHLEMIAQAARGEYSPKRGELERRQAAVIAFMRTGQCVADMADHQMIQTVKSALIEMSHLAIPDTMSVGLVS